MKKDLDPAFAGEVAADFIAKTKDLFARCEVAGSLRRKKPVVHDIDIAVIPRGRDFAAWRDKVKTRVVEIGGKVVTFGDVMTDFVYRDVQINLFICPTTDSWGATLMWATGPKGHTIGMTLKARDRGLLINSTGIWTREAVPRLVPARTEEAVGRILGWKYKPPQDRGIVERKDKSPY